MKQLLACITLLLSMAISSYAQTGSWHGELEVQGSSLTLVFHINKDGCTIDSPDQAAYGIEAEFSSTGLGKVTINIPSLGAKFEGIYLSRQIVGSFSQGGLSFALTLRPGTPQLNRPQTPSGPFPYSTEEVSFSNGDAVLKGTLSLPEGYDMNTPVLLMVTGSGLQNRDEEIYEHKPFAVIADAFARNGIATLRYDDRSFGESSGDASLATIKDFKNDALAGINLLRERFEKVGVLGHSEGGTIALMLAAEHQADFIISLAGMVISGKETLLLQNRHQLATAGIEEAMIDNYCKALEECFDAIIQEKDMPSVDKYILDPALRQNLQMVQIQMENAYLKDFISIDIRKDIPNISCPILALNGSKDTQVDHQKNLEALRAGLSSGTKSKIEVCEGLNHLFQHCQTGDVSEYKKIEETISTDVLSLMTTWVKEL